MTYCVGVLLNSGLLFASDTRTNAGVDNVSKFCKMRVFDRPGDRVIVAMSSGNLSVTQNALNRLEQQARDPDDPHTLWTARSMFDVAGLLGEALREIKRRDGPSLLASNIDMSCNFILGGQIGDEPPRLFLVYSEGNFIEATADSCYFQIGEIKYGKPIIDRVIQTNTPFVDAIKATLVSFDSTMRSNISVGLPIDLLPYQRDSLVVTYKRRVEENDPYWQMIHNTWGDGLREVFGRIPPPQWGV